MISEILKLLAAMQNINSLSIVTPTFNEEENIEEIINSVYEIMLNKKIAYKHIIIDNCSTDSTVEVVRRKMNCNSNMNIKLIVNNENYGPIISPVAGILHCRTDATVIISSDFEDPPYLIHDFIDAINQGYDFAAGVIVNSNENIILKNLRFLYYSLLKIFVKKSLIKNFNGYCIMSERVIEKLRSKDSFYLFLRSEIVTASSNYKIIEYEKKMREKGVSKNNILQLLNLAIIGLLANNVQLIRKLILIYLLSLFFIFCIFSNINEFQIFSVTVTAIFVFVYEKLIKIKNDYINNYKNSKKLYKVKYIYE
jgi:glycosyltransferase involved in cell wall biosynthesis